MFTRRSVRIVLALGASCCLAGGVASVVGGSASAADARPKASITQSDRSGADSPHETSASKWSPFIANNPHVPASVGLAVGPGGEVRYLAKPGSMFDGTAPQVERRVDAWWDNAMAHGISPKDADEMLKRGFEVNRQDASSEPGLASIRSPFIPGVAHIPAGVALTVSPDGQARYMGPGGSMFDGTADQVEAHLKAWWADQMAAGITPDEADQMLIELAQ